MRPGSASALPSSGGWSKRDRAFYATVAPFFVIFAVFSLFPVLFSLYLGFNRWDGFGRPEFVGLDNYLRALDDPVFRKAIWNTFVVWIASAAVTVALAFGLAVLVNEYVVVGRQYFRIVFLFPLLVAPAVSAVILRVMFSSNGGIVNTVIGAITGEPYYFDWLGSEAWIKPLVVLLVVWRWTGWHFIIFLSGLQSISRDLHEAARIDGASRVQIFLHVTVPLMLPTLAFSITNATLGGLQIFDEPFVLTAGTGGTDNATTTLGMYLYATAFTNFDFGLGSAVSWYIFTAITLLTIFYHRLLGRMSAGTA